MLVTHLQHFALTLIAVHEPRRLEGKTPYIEVMTDVITFTPLQEQNDYAQAQEIGLKICRFRFPESEGYQEHSVSLVSFRIDENGIPRSLCRDTIERFKTNLALGVEGP